MDDSTEPTFEIWGVQIATAGVDDTTLEYLKQLPSARPTLEWVWAEMDRVWRDLGLDNLRALDDQPIGEFYGHPVWAMNGIFTAGDPESVAHRDAIADFIADQRPRSVIDYGGGFGELAGRVKGLCPDTAVAVFEAFPSQLARRRLDSLGIDLIDDVAAGTVDVAVAQDVLEHVDRPLDLAATVAGLVRPGGIVIFANSFHPQIECHLPRTFHLRHTFSAVMRLGGFRSAGRVPGAPHAVAFEVPRHRRRVGWVVGGALAKPIGTALNASAEARQRVRGSWL